MKKRIILIILVLSISLVACIEESSEPPRENIVVEEQRASTEDAAGEAREAATLYGYSVEVWNLVQRVIRTNDPAHIQYVYFISPYTGEIIFQATAVGKVTSTTRRLEPRESYELSTDHDRGDSWGNNWLFFERVSPDGAYGSSTPGIVWFDTAGLMYEAKIEGALILILERPFVFESGEINLSVDIRLQGQLDLDLDAQRVRISEYIRNNPDWRPGDEIPLWVLTGEEQ